jgi:outer membrane protein
MKCTLIVAMLALGLPIFGQALRLDIPDAWHKALLENPQMQRQDADLEATRIQVDVESADRLPVFSLKGGYQYNSEVSELSIFGNSLKMGVHDRWDYSAGVQQPIFTGFRTDSAILAAQADTLARAASIRQTADQLRLQIAVRFCEVQSVDDQFEALQRGIDRADRQLRRIRSLLAAEQATPLDTLEISNRKLELETGISQNRHQRNILVAQLQELVNCPFEPVLNVDRPGIQPVEPGPWIDKALYQRSEFAALDARGTRLDQMRRTALSTLYPQVFATAEYHYGIPGMQMINPDWGDYYTVGVQAQWKPWDWGQARKRARVAELNRRQTDCDRAQLTARVRREITEVVEQMNSLADRTRLQGELAKQEVQRRNAILNKFEQRQSTALDLRDAEARVTEAECALAQLKAQWEESRYQLLYVSGTIGGDL